MTTTIPLRLRILSNLTDVLKEITTANGYATDTNDHVYRGRVIFGDNDPLPLLSILEVPIPLDQDAVPTDSEFSSGGWELMLQGFVEDDPTNPTDPAHYFMADAKKRLAIEKRKAYADEPEDGILGLGNFITGLRIGAGVVRPPDEISAKAYFWLTITLDMVENLADPYEE
jgi:hypothetical protein